MSQDILETMYDPKKQKSLSTVVKNIELFSTNFYKTVSKDKNSNFICSPISASIALAMTAFGAKNNTEKEIRSVLNFCDDDEVNKLGYQHLVDTFNAVKSVQLNIANKIFVDKNMNINDVFVSITKDYFRSKLQLVNFQDTETARKIINKWCEKKTNNLIKDILQPDDINLTTRLVIVNAIYFKGTWKYKFDIKRTKLNTFNVNNKIQKDVLMMEQKASYNTGHLPDLDAIYVELPYESNSIEDAMSMFIILPNKIDGLKCIDKNLHKIDFRHLHKNIYKREVMLKLPKFKIESRIELDATLKEMGINDMFDIKKADFSRISEDLYVDKVIQKAFIKVDEEGSEAAAVTAVLFKMRCRPAPIREITVDRPFLCAIVATKTGTQLFNARVVDPVSEKDLDMEQDIFEIMPDPIKQMSMSNLINIQGKDLNMAQYSLRRMPHLIKKQKRLTVMKNIEIFSTNFYKTVSKDKNSNFICSPISASIALAMTAFGAKNNTEKEIRSVLNLCDDDEVNKLGYQHLVDTFNKSKNVQLDITNQIFAAKDIKINHQFESIIKDIFKSELQLVDFKDNEAAQKIINCWFENKTNKRIKNILQSDDIGPSTRLEIVNAVHFKGTWKYGFDIFETKSEPFNIDEKIQKNVLMMEQKRFYNTGHLPKLDAIYVELPYKSNSEEDAISMFIILPNKVDGLQNIEENLHKVNFKELHANVYLLIYKRETILKLPKFKIENKIVFIDTLKKMGMNDMFDKEKADFSGITKESLFVNKVIQKVFMEVNEEGSLTETATTSILYDGPPQPTREIIVDRPFFCAIVATKTGTQLLNARVVDPSEDFSSYCQEDQSTSTQHAHDVNMLIDL